MILYRNTSRADIHPYKNYSEEYKGVNDKSDVLKMNYLGAESFGSSTLV